MNSLRQNAGELESTAAVWTVIERFEIAGLRWVHRRQPTEADLDRAIKDTVAQETRPSCGWEPRDRASEPWLRDQEYTPGGKK